MKKVLDFILNIVSTGGGSIFSILAIAGKVLNIALDLAGRIASAFGWKPAERFVDFIEKHNIEGWLERIAKILKKFKGSSK